MLTVLSLFDERVRPKGSRDPLGIEPYGVVAYFAQSAISARRFSKRSDRE